MQIAVIGLGGFGYKLAESLYAMGGEVVALDHREELIESIKNHVTQAVCLDATDEKALRAIGMADIDTAIVAIANDIEPSILVTTLLRQMGVTKIIARAVSDIHEKVLREVGASQILRIEEQMAEHIAKTLITPDILKQYAFASGYSLVEMRSKSQFIGKRIKELKLRENYNLGVAALEKRSPDVDESGRSIYKTLVTSPPDPDDIIKRDDILVLFGLDSSIQKFTSENE